jgi:hypothetical protein
LESMIAYLNINLIVRFFALLIFFLISMLIYLFSYFHC